MHSTHTYIKQQIRICVLSKHTCMSLCLSNSLLALQLLIQFKIWSLTLWLPFENFAKYLIFILKKKNNRENKSKGNYIILLEIKKLVQLF